MVHMKLSFSKSLIHKVRLEEEASKRERRGGIDDLDDRDKRAISKGKKKQKITNLKRIDQNSNSNNKEKP